MGRPVIGKLLLRGVVAALIGMAPLLLAGCGSGDDDSRNAAFSPGNFEISVDNPYQLQSGPDLRDLDVTADLVAQRFTSNNTPTRITLITVRMSRGAELGTPREVVVSLHSSVNRMPGPSIAQLGARSVDPGYEAMRTVPIASSPVLAASREYFIVVSAGAGSGSLSVQSAVNEPLSNVAPAPEFESFQTPVGEPVSWLPTGTSRNLVMTVVVEAAGASASESTTSSSPAASPSSTSNGGSSQTTQSASVPTTTTVADAGDTGEQSASPATTSPGAGPQPGVATTNGAGTSGTATPDTSAGTSTGDTTAPSPDDSSVGSVVDSTIAPTDTVVATDENTDSADTVVSPAKGSAYSPADDPETTRDLAATLAAFAALLAAGAATSMVGSVSGGPSRGRLSTLATKKLKSTATSRSGAGDAGALWRRRGTDRVDAVFSRIPASVAPYSSVVPRVLVDGSWARAMTGSMSMLLWPIAAVVGVLWGLDTGDSVGLPVGWLLALALVIGVLDSMAGGIVSLAVTVVALASGAITEWSDVRTAMGVWVVLLSPALIGNVIRPLRRVVHDIDVGLRERIFDYVMAPVGVAFAIEAMTNALNGLSGTVIADASDLTLVKWTVWIAMIARLALEDLAARFFPERSRTVQPARLPGQSKTWGALGASLRFGLYLFVSEPFFGLGWATVFAALLLTVPFAIKPWEDDLPNNAALWKWLPRGFLRFAILVVLGGWLGVALLGDSPTADTVRAMTPWLFLPSAAFGIIEYFGRSGEPWPDSPVKRWGGAVLWGFVVLVLAGVIVPF